MRISHAGMSPAPPPAPSTLPRLARRLDGVAGVPRPSRSGLGVCLGPRPSSFASLVIQRRCESLARLSRSSRVGGVRLSRRRPSHAALVAATALLAFRPLRVPIRRVPQAPSVFACVAPRRDELPSWHGPSAPFVFAASLVVVAASQITPASLAKRVVGTRLPHRRPSLASLVATTALLAFRVSRVPISACASGPVDLRSLRSSSRRRCKSLARLSRSRVVGVRL